jgi:hypothetical protein
MRNAHERKEITKEATFPEIPRRGTPAKIPTDWVLV